MEFYKICVIFDILVLELQAIAIYFIMKQSIKTRLSYIVAVILAIIAIVGYPLNSCIMGFVYLSLCILIIISQILIFQEVDNKRYKTWLKFLMIFLTNFGVFFSYWFFAPVTFFAIIIYHIKSNKKIFSKSIFLFAIITILIPSICGIQFMFKPKRNKIQQSYSANSLVQIHTNTEKVETKYIAGINASKLEKNATNEGYIYRNVISNFIPFIPLILLAIYFEVKNKNISYATIFFISLILFVFATYIMVELGLLSTYAFFKSYYLLWPISVYMVFKAYIELLKPRNKIRKYNMFSCRNNVFIYSDLFIDFYIRSN